MYLLEKNKLRKIMLILYKTQKAKEERVPLNQFYETRINLRAKIKSDRKNNNKNIQTNVFCKP